MTTARRLAFAAFAALLLTPARAHAFLGLPLHDSSRALRDVIATRHTDALETATCGQQTRLSAEQGILCAGSDSRPVVVVTADALRDAGFKFGAHDGKAHLAYHGELRLRGPMTEEEIAAVVDEVQDEQARERQRKAVEQYLPLQGQYSIEDLFNAAPR